MDKNEIVEKIKQIFNNQLHIDCLSVEKNSDSTDGNVYMIKCATDKFIAKVYDDIKHANSMVMLHNTLSKMIHIPQIIYSDLNDEATNKNHIVIYSFMKGTPIDEKITNGKIDSEIIKKIGKTIHQMHDLASQGNKFQLPELPFDTINQRRAMLHFDLTKSNIFANENDEISIIDFDDAMYGSAIYDISILIAFFFFSETRGVDLEGMHTFLDSYYEEDEVLKNEEIKHIKVCVTQWVDYLTSNKELPDDLIECFKTKCKMINESI